MLVLSTTFRRFATAAIRAEWLSSRFLSASNCFWMWGGNAVFFSTGRLPLAWEVGGSGGASFGGGGMLEVGGGGGGGGGAASLPFREAAGGGVCLDSSDRFSRAKAAIFIAFPNADVSDWGCGDCGLEVVAVVIPTCPALTLVFAVATGRGLLSRACHDSRTEATAIVLSSLS